MQCPQLAVRLQVFTESFNLVIRPAGSPVSSNPGLGDALQSAEGILFLAEDDEAFLNSVHEQELAELEPSNVAIQIGSSGPEELDCLAAGAGGGKYY